MPVSMFSKIKIRRGKKDELPDLDKAEFGFATDSGEVFIGAPDFPPLENKGRGETGEQFPYKNVQLITNGQDHSDIQKTVFQGNGPVIAQTGPTLSQPIVRTYRERFDDTIYFDNFYTGAQDIVPDLNRALRQVYNNSAVSERKPLIISAGEYVVNQTIKVPPQTHLKGEGKDKTILRHTDPSDTTGITHLFETVDRLFQENLQISFAGGGVPENIEISDMTIIVPRLMDFFRLYRSRNITFRNVRFQGSGAVISPTSVIRFDRLGIVVTMRNFKFIDCDFNDVSNIVSPIANTTNLVTDVQFERCNVTNVFSALLVDNNNAENISWSNSIIRGVQDGFMTLTRGRNVSSYNNTIDSPSLPAPKSPYVIASTFNNFSSFQDKFILGTNVRAFNNSSKTSVIIPSNSSRLVMNDLEINKPFSSNILSNQNDTAIGPAYPLSRYSTIKIDYVIKRDSGLKTGVINLTHLEGNPVIFDTSNTIGIPDVVFSATVETLSGEDHLVLRYSTNDIGTTGTIKMVATAVYN
jgi:hypothetical protein